MCVCMHECIICVCESVYVCLCVYVCVLLLLFQCSCHEKDLRMGYKKGYQLYLGCSIWPSSETFRIAQDGGGSCLSHDFLILLYSLLRTQWLKPTWIRIPGWDTKIPTRMAWELVSRRCYQDYEVQYIAEAHEVFALAIQESDFKS